MEPTPETVVIQPPKQSLGERIKAHRKAMGLSQTQFGVLIGASQNQISAVERGIGRLNPEQLKRLELLLGSSFTDEGDQNNGGD